MLLRVLRLPYREAPELLKHNPLGMVPTLVSEATFKEDPSLGPMVAGLRTFHHVISQSKHIQYSYA